MEISGEERIAAPRHIVWAALNDPEILRQCIPGCQTLEQKFRLNLLQQCASRSDPSPPTSPAR